MTSGGEIPFSSKLPRVAELVVIGGGVVGAATAFFAARAGLETVLLERRPMLGTLSTSAATGAFRLQFDNADELEVVRESVHFFRHFAERTGLLEHDLGLVEQGYLWVARDEETAERQQERVARQRAWGLDDVEILGSAELHRRFPYLSPDALQARYRAGDGWLDPRQLTVGLARASGATLVSNVEVRSIDVSEGRVRGVETSKGSLTAKAVVIAAGNFSRTLARTVGIDLPIRLVRRHRLVMLEVPDVPVDAPMTIDESNGTHWRPAGNGAHLMRPDPDEPSGDALEDVPTQESFAFDMLDPARPFAAAGLVPFWRDVWARGAGPWLLKAGQYDLTPDHRALLGPTTIEGLHVNCGHSGHGVMASVGAGRRVVDLLLGRLDPERNPFRADRPMAGRERDVL
jgi:sarcosine oxidase subunit beta